jgi:polysaccharide biosynthesis transport protein
MDRKQLNGHDSHHENYEVVPYSHSGEILNGRAYTDALPGTTESTDDFAILMQFARILWKRKWVLLSTTALGGLIGIGIALRVTPQYRASTTMEIQNSQEQPFGGKLAASDPMITTQVELLSSSGMRQRAVSKLLGKTDVQPPRVVGPLVTLRKLLRLEEPATSTKWNSAVFGAAAGATAKITKESRVVVISSQSANPQAAAAFTNTLAEEYIRRIQEDRWESYQNTGEFLTQAQQELKAKVEQSDARLANFAKSKGLVYTGTQNVAEDKLKQLQAQLLAATADRITKQSVWEASQNSPTESLPAVLDSGPMAAYQTKISDLKRELAELSTTLTPSHYRIQRVQAQIDELEKERTRERTNVMSRIRIEYQATLKRENDLQRAYDEHTRALAGQADDIIQYNLLQREAETNKKLYELALQQGKEASLASAMRTNSARIIDRAGPPLVAVTPNLFLDLWSGMFAGFVCGGLLVIVRSRMNTNIQAPGVLELRMNLRELGVIPSAARDPELNTLSLRGGNSSGRRGRTKLAGADSPSDCLELVTWNRKPSLIAEAFRATMTSILFLGENGNRPRVFVITSAAPQEGKSTVVSNLAIALAEINHRVLLIDADMRLPRIHSIFDLPNTFGLSDILHEQKPVQDYMIESVVRKTYIPDLYVLPAGPARMNLSRLLHSSRMKELIMRFRETFGTILIDTAPVLNVPDSRILARVSDGVILVVRAHKTHQEAAFAAVRCFAADGHRILGTILNDWDPKLSTYGQYGSYGPYYSQYYSIDGH